jgi:hypothetical protein
MLRFAPIVLLSLAACVVEEEDVTSEASQTLMGCPWWGCNENSPVMGPYNFHEGNVYGLENSARVRFLNFQIGGQIYEPRIINGSQLIAVSSGGTVVSGVNLTNGWFNVWTPSGMYRIIVKHVNPAAVSGTQFWLGPATGIETYELSYTGPGSTSDRLCKNPPNGRLANDNNNTIPAPLEAILFTGDRYDVDTKRVSAVGYSATNGWFNIACAGSALAKLHLNRHTTAGTTAGYFATQPERTAMLKMYVSDVCGTGKAFTQAGVPLHWENAQGWDTLTGFETKFEAIWTANGAACLDTHRLGALFMSDITADCGGASMLPPPCNGSVASPVFGLGEYFATAIP